MCALTPSASCARPPALLELSAVQLAHLIKRKDISPVELVEQSIERCQEIQALCNPIAVELYRCARSAARRAEADVLRGHPLGRLHGVPFSIKEGLGLAGWPQTCGSTLRRQVTASSTATVAQRLISAGGIPVALGNQAEMALWPETDNLLYGRTLNPYRASRTAGGSSGGDAVMVASACVPFALGTDGAGSVRIPAAFNGVFGLKPSRGLVPLSGHLPLDERGREQANAQAVSAHFAAGPLCRHAEDLSEVLQIIAGPDGIDRNIHSRFAPVAEPARLRRVHLYLPERMKWSSPVSEAVSQALNDAGQCLASQGATLHAWQEPGMHNAFFIWLAVLKLEAQVRLADYLGDGQPLSYWRAARASLAGRARHATGPLLATWLDSVGDALGNPGLGRFLAQRDHLQRAFAELFDGHSVLLMPVTPGVAPEHGHALKRPLDVAYCALFNALGLPALSVPMGRLDQGCPVAVQLVAGPGQDALLLDAAVFLQTQFGGWLKPALSHFKG